MLYIYNTKKFYFNVNINILKHLKKFRKIISNKKKYQTALPNRPKHVESIIRVKIHLLKRRLARQKHQVSNPNIEVRFYEPYHLHSTTNCVLIGFKSEKQYFHFLCSQLGYFSR